MVRGLLKPEPAVGDLFVLWHEGLKRYAHIGFVTALVDSPSDLTREDGLAGFRSRRSMPKTSAVRSRTSGVG